MICFCKVKVLKSNQNIQGRISPFLQVVLGMKYLCYETVSGARGACNGISIKIEDVVFVDDCETMVRWNDYLHMHVIDAIFVKFPSAACIGDSVPGGESQVPSAPSMWKNVSSSNPFIHGPLYLIFRRRQQ